jgi:hypothetical protein
MLAESVAGRLLDQSSEKSEEIAWSVERNTQRFLWAFPREASGWKCAYPGISVLNCCMCYSESHDVQSSRITWSSLSVTFWVASMSICTYFVMLTFIATCVRRSVYRMVWQSVSMRAQEMQHVSTKTNFAQSPFERSLDWFCLNNHHII